MKNKTNILFVLAMSMLSIVLALDSCNKDSSGEDETGSDGSVQVVDNNTNTSSTTADTDASGNASTDSDGNTQTTTPTEKQTNIWTGSTDFNDPNWSGNIQIGASNKSKTIISL